MWVEALLIAGVAVLPLPALAVGVRGLLAHRGFRTGRTAFGLLVLLRVVVLLLVFALSGLTLLTAVGALVRDLDLPKLVYTFFAVDLLLAAVVVLTFGRPDRRRRRRPASPAAR